jgi:hypothetical protein
MHSLKHVNALATDQSVEFAPCGVTVIYGENAAGKSGYSRVLKKACHAREKKSEVLPNVFDAAVKGQPQAAFDISVDGGDVAETWINGNPPPESLSRVAVFDSNCARVFVDEANDVVYMPYGLDVFAKLATLCKTFKDRLDGEIRVLPSAPAVLTEFSDSTVVGKLVTRLKQDTPSQDIEALAQFTETDANRLNEVERLVAEFKLSDPKPKVALLKRQIRRIERLLIAIEKLDSSLSDENVWKLKSVLDDAKTYQEAARLASAQAFESEPLPGVGSDPWRLVFASAKYYSEQIAYPGEEFPATESGMRCVLCQQPLEDEARQRLRRFAEFVKQDVERICAQKSKLFTDALEAIRKVDVEVSFAVLAGGELCHLRNVL